MRLLAPAVLAATLAATASAMAGGIEQFTTPSRNIGCIASEIEGEAVLRCDMRAAKYPKPR